MLDYIDMQVGLNRSSEDSLQLTGLQFLLSSIEQCKDQYLDEVREELERCISKKVSDTIV